MRSRRQGGESLSLFPGALSRVSLPLSLSGKNPSRRRAAGEEADSSSSSSDPAVAAAYLGKLN